MLKNEIDKKRAIRDGLTDIGKANGITYGLAIGDALGFPTEFMTLDRIKPKYGAGGIMDLPDPARFSDDTQMSIAVAEALVGAGDKDIEPIMEAVKDEFISWFHSSENNRSPGNTCLKGVANMERGVHWSQSGLVNSKGCGSAMRVGPIGYLYQHDQDKLKEVAHATGICTHGHPAGDAACIGAAYLVKLALYCFLRNPESYEKVVIRGVNTNGDSDSIACIVGSISGAYLGIEGIPTRWVKRIEKSPYLEDLSQRLAAKKEAING